jgi:hypothetical protein
VSRPFGAGLGIGTFCDNDGVAMPPIDAAIRIANAVRVELIENRSAIRGFRFLVNASSCRAFGSFIVLYVKRISFFRENIVAIPVVASLKGADQKRPSSSSIRISRFPA